MAPHSSTLAWKIPWTEEPGGLQSMRSLRVGHEWATSLSCIGEGNGNPLQCSRLENPRDGGAWWAAVYGVAQSQTRLKWLSSRIFLGTPYTMAYTTFIHQNLSLNEESGCLTTLTTYWKDFPTLNIEEDWLLTRLLVQGHWWNPGVSLTSSSGLH